MELKFLDDVQPKHPKKRLHFVMVGVTVAIIVVAVSYTIIRKNADAADSDVFGNSKSQLLIPNSVQSIEDTNNIFSDVSAMPSNSKKSVFSQSEDWRLVLVSNSVELPKNFQPKIISYYGVNIDQRLIQPFEAMKRGAAKENITLWITSAYRSAEKQKALFDAEVQKNRAKRLSQQAAESAAQKSVARPGHSEHNTGLGIDLNGAKQEFEDSKAFTWLQRHAVEYGFILRYPKEKESITGVSFEPWHYRFVGKENAVAIRERGLCLEEYLAKSG